VPLQSAMIQHKQRSNAYRKVFPTIVANRASSLVSTESVSVNDENCF